LTITWASLAGGASIFKKWPKNYLGYSPSQTKRDRNFNKILSLFFLLKNDYFRKTSHKFADN
jgi:hypothetical protein